jgi:Protein of unknown function (DUF3313)
MTNSLRRKMMTTMAAAGLAALLLASGCSTTVESTPEAAKALESGGPLPSSVTGFLGPDASKLAPGPEGGAALVWINPNAQWASYTKIQLMPVEFWATADSKVSTADQATLTEYFYNQLQTNLSKSFTLVDQPGPGVMTLRVALMDATTAVPGLRTVSVIVPQARVLNLAQSMATDSYAFVGSAEAEMKLNDSVTGALLVEAVDQRADGLLGAEDPESHFAAAGKISGAELRICRCRRASLKQNEFGFKLSDGQTARETEDFDAQLEN